MSSGLRNRLPAQAALEMLAEGGSGLDAALAAAVTLTLVEPVSNGIGSAAFAIVWDGRQLHGFNASGRSPAGWTLGVHLQIEALKLAFADALAYVADIDHIQVRPGQLLDKGYLKQRSTLIDRTHTKGVTAGTSPKGGTVYLTAADASGLMVPMIQSNYMGFGSGGVVHGTGVSLQNRGTGFVTTPGHPNLVGANKRPYDGPRFRWLQDMQVSVEGAFRRRRWRSCAVRP
jgi:gamma-glutamyltranspeptidase